MVYLPGRQLTWAVPALGIALLTAACSADTPADRQARLCPTHPDDIRRLNGIPAFVESQSYVGMQLKAPSTAKWPYISDRDVHVSYREGCTYVVKAWVDAQNGFGAEIRTIYVMKLRYNPVDDTWIYLDLTMN